MILRAPSIQHVVLGLFLCFGALHGKAAGLLSLGMGSGSYPTLRGTLTAETGHRYVIVQMDDLLHPPIPVGLPFALLSQSTNISLPFTNAAGFFTAGLAEPTFFNVAIKTNGLIDSLFMVIGITAPAYNGVSLDSVPVTAFSVNPNHPEARSYVAWVALYGYKDARCTIPVYDWPAIPDVLGNQLSDAVPEITNGAAPAILHFEVNHKQRILRVPAGETRYLAFCGQGNYSSGTYTLAIPNSIEKAGVTNLLPQYLVNGGFVWSPATNTVHTNVLWANGYGLIDPTKLTNTRSY